MAPPKLGNHHSLFTIDHSPFLSNLFQQRIDPLSLFFEGVAHEVKRGSMPQIERETKLPPHIRRRMAQGSQSQLVFALVPGYGDINRRVTEIVGHAHFSNGHYCQPRVLKFVTHNLRNLFPQRLSNALRPVHTTDVSSFKFRVSSFEFQVSSFEFQVSSFGGRVLSFELTRGPSFKPETRNPKLETRNINTRNTPTTPSRRLAQSHNTRFGRRV